MSKERVGAMAGRAWQRTLRDGRQEVSVSVDGTHLRAIGAPAVVGSLLATLDPLVGLPAIAQAPPAAVIDGQMDLSDFGIPA